MRAGRSVGGEGEGDDAVAGRRGETGGGGSTGGKVAGTGGAIGGVDTYVHACGLSGRLLRLTVDNEGTTPLMMAALNGQWT